MKDWHATPVWIIQRNNLDRGFRGLIEWLQRAGMTDITILDNASTWPPLLEYFQTMKDVKLIHQSENLGHEVFWKLNYHLHQSGRFIITDPDVVPTPDCPLDLVYHMHQIADQYAPAKVGPGLRIDNMHPNYFKREFQQDWEAQFWENPTPCEKGFEALLDTTFALYEPGWERWPPAKCIRLAPPYLMNHIPWMEDSTVPNEEREFYKATCLPGINHC